MNNQDIEQIKTRVAELAPGNDYIYRVFRCGKCEQVFPFRPKEEYQSNVTLDDAHKCVICREYIGLICVFCVDRGGANRSCIDCGEKLHISIRCNEVVCQGAPIPDKRCRACNHREKSFS